jgi:hypothetical protein
VKRLAPLPLAFSLHTSNFTPQRSVRRTFELAGSSEACASNSVGSVRGKSFRCSQFVKIRVIRGQKTKPNSLEQQRTVFILLLSVANNNPDSSRFKARQNRPSRDNDLKDCGFQDLSQPELTGRSWPSGLKLGYSRFARTPICSL